MAKITVAMSAGGFPIPNTTTKGTRYTNGGIVCIMSRIGLIDDCKADDFAAAIPRGIPKIRQATVAASIKARVNIVASHRPNVIMNSSPSAVNNATRQLAIK